MEWRVTMNKYKIVALFGPSGSGKDYIQENIMKTIWGKLHFQKIVSFTTRPPREKEIDGIDYHFLTRQDFSKQDLLEFTVFKNWWYGTPINSLDKNKINIGVFNPSGIDQLINGPHKDIIECIPIYIKTYSKIRLLRQLQREEQPDCDEIVRRYLADKRDFSNLNFSYKVVENNYDEIEMVIKEIFDLTHEEWNDLDKMN